MQSRFWGLAKHALGRRPLVFDIVWNNTRDSLLVLIQRVSNESTIAYAPWAPTFSVSEGERGNFLEELSAEIKALSARRLHLYPL